jgi:hypothetical protein
MAVDLGNLPPALVAAGCELTGSEGEADERGLTVAGMTTTVGGFRASCMASLA